MSAFENAPGRGGRTDAVESLTDQLSEWLSQVDETSCDAGAAAHILAQLDAADGMEPDFDADTELEAFHRKFAPLFEAAREETPRAVRGKRALRRLGLLAIAAAVLFALLITVQALGVDVFGSIARWTSDTFSLDDPPNLQVQSEITKRPLREGEERYYDSLQAALDDFGITAKMAPTWIPERFQQAELVEIYASATPYISIGANYIISDDDIFSYTIHEKNENAPFSVEKDAHEPRSLMIHHQVFFIFDHYDVINAAWSHGDVEGYTFGRLTEEELTKILYSIYD